MVVAKVVVASRFAGNVSPILLRGGGAGRRADEKRRSLMPVKRGGKRKANAAAVALPHVLSSLPPQNEDFIGTVLSKNDNIFFDIAYVENDAWWGWAFAPGGFVLGPSILFALYILGTLIFDAVAKQMKTKEEEDE
jgi:hypothetical protein